MKFICQTLEQRKLDNKQNSIVTHMTKLASLTNNAHIWMSDTQNIDLHSILCKFQIPKTNLEPPKCMIVVDNVGFWLCVDFGIVYQLF
jgi:hypothetical protein